MIFLVLLIKRTFFKYRLCPLPFFFAFASIVFNCQLYSTNIKSANCKLASITTMHDIFQIYFKITGFNQFNMTFN